MLQYLYGENNPPSHAIIHALIQFARESIMHMLEPRAFAARE